MSKTEKQKIKALVLYEILRTHSDEDHPLSTNELIKLLSDNGIEAARKAVYDDIRLLNEFGYEVLLRKGRSNLYYVVDRKFEEPELRILMDAVASANFITEKKTKELTDKIAELAGTHRAKLLTKNIVYSDTTKHSNEKIYYAVDAIDRAILKGKKVAFKYFDLDCHGQRKYRKDGELYVVNPLSLIFNDSRYYLACYSDKYLDLSNYRVDRMDEVVVLNENITDARCRKDFNATRHIKQAFSMFCGKLEDVVFAVDKDEKYLSIVFDKFGEKIKFTKADDRYKFSAKLQISNVFYGWCAQFGDKIEILEPLNVREDYKEYISNILNIYADKE